MSNDIDDKKLLKKMHQQSSKHILCLEVKPISNSNIEKLKIKHNILHTMELGRRFKNIIIKKIRNNLIELLKNKEYKNLLLNLKNIKNKLKELNDENLIRNTKKEIENIFKNIENIRNKFNVSWDFCRKLTELERIKFNDKKEKGFLKRIVFQEMPKGFQEKFIGISAVQALTIAEDIWKGVEKCLFGKGKNIRFQRKNINNPLSIRAKQIDREICLNIKNNEIFFKWKNYELKPIIKDDFQLKEINEIIKYQLNANEIEQMAFNLYKEKQIIINTFRPIFAILKAKIIRNKIRFFIHLCINSTPLPKYKKDETIKHKLGVGNVGCDIGTQTFAYCSDKEVGLKNLAQRGRSIQKNERKQRIINRKLDRSRRATNPQNYNFDGSIKELKKGEKRIWNKSNNYKKLFKKYQNISRINAENRKIAINTDINYLRSLGDTFITESKNADKLMRRVKKTTINKKTGKINKKKRFGKSIQNRCPGYFQQQAKLKFPNYIEVPNDYRASQYDHTADDYIKKDLNDRYYALQDGTMVQRDMYSAFLLFNINLLNKFIDKEKCKSNFNNFYQLQNKRIYEIQQNKEKIFNSGIKLKI